MTKHRARKNPIGGVFDQPSTIEQLPKDAATYYRRALSNQVYRYSKIGRKDQLGNDVYQRTFQGEPDGFVAITPYAKYRKAVLDYARKGITMGVPKLYEPVDPETGYYWGRTPNPKRNPGGLAHLRNPKAPPRRATKQDIHLMLPRGGAACGAVGTTDADIDWVTCPKCLRIHEKWEEAHSNPAKGERSTKRIPKRKQNRKGPEGRLLSNPRTRHAVTAAPKVGSTIQIPWAYDFANGYVELRVKHVQRNGRSLLVEGTITKLVGESAQEGAVGDEITVAPENYRTVKANPGIAKGARVTVRLGTPWPRDAQQIDVTGKVVRVRGSVATVDVEQSRANPGGHPNEDVAYVDVPVSALRVTNPRRGLK